MPQNPLIAEPLFRIRYIEKAGTGTTDMIADCRKAGLPEPDFEQCGPHFVVTVWRDWLTDEVLAEYNLNDRQKKAVVYLKTHGKISNTEYQQVANSIKKTATRDLNDLKKKGIISQVGSRGPGVHYVITKKRDKMGTMGTYKGQMGHSDFTGTARDRIRTSHDNKTLMGLMRHGFRGILI